MKPHGINLKTAFPGYMVTLDPACEDPRDPWMFQIPGRLGTIYPYGHDWLAVGVDYHPSVVRMLKATPTVQLTQSGDGECTFIFPKETFTKVANLVKSRKKKQLSAKTLTTLRANAAKARAARMASNSK